MMKPQTSPRDLKTLSLYLDDQLNFSERKRLEKRLNSDQTLRSTLEELRQTRLAYKNMPRVRSPRNFTLTPQMIGSSLPQKVYPVWGFVSAIASVLFVLILAGDLLGIYIRPTSTTALRQSSEIEAAAPAAESLQNINASVAPTNTAQATESSMAQAQEAFKAAAPATNESTAQSTPATPLAFGAAASGITETATPLLEGMSVKEAPSPNAGGPGEVSSTMMMSDTLQTSLPPAQALAEDETQLLVSSPTPSIGEETPVDIASQNEPSPQQGEAKRVSTDSRQVMIWILEGFFAITAIITGLIVFYQKRKASHARR